MVFRPRNPFEAPGPSSLQWALSLCLQHPTPWRSDLGGASGGSMAIEIGASDGPSLLLQIVKVAGHGELSLLCYRPHELSL